MVGKAKPPTKAEKHRMDILKNNVPCVPCIMLKKTSLPEVHHVVSGMRREGHNSTYSCCLWHHRGEPINSWERLDGASGGAIQATSGLLGPSLAHGKRTYQEFFGPESLLVAIASRLVRSYEESPWMDYHVPINVLDKAREYWESKL